MAAVVADARRFRGRAKPTCLKEVTP